MKTIAVVPLSKSGFWLKATSSPRPTDTDGTALGMKNSRPSALAHPSARARSASAAQAPVTSASRLATNPVTRLAIDRVARRAAGGVAIVLQGEAGRQNAVPLLREARAE